MQIGEFDVQIISGGRFKLDGGAMYGIIPRPLWTRVAAPDDRGRIQMDANCLLVRTPDELVLIDTGNGPKMSEKDRAIFDMRPGEELLEHLAAAGVRPEAITTVLLTHLHMDHVGGATRLVGEEVVPAFANARCVVQRREWEDAIHNRSHMRASYRLENLEPLQRAGQIELLDGDAEVLPGISVQVTGGHTPGHHCIFIRSGGETLLYPADICPTVGHLRPPYNMAYDRDPYRTMQVKAELLARAADEDWLVVFDHEPEQKVVRLRRAGDALEAVPAA